MVERLDIALADAAVHRAAAAGPGTIHRTGSGRRLSRVPSGGHAAGSENPASSPNPEELRRGSLLQPRRTSIVSRRSSIVRRASISSAAGIAAAAAPEAPRPPEFFPELMVLLKARLHYQDFFATLLKYVLGERNRRVASRVPAHAAQDKARMISCS